MRSIEATRGDTRQVNLSDLIRLSHVAARGKRRFPTVARFLLDVDRECALLAAELASRVYRPGRGRSFWIHDPKRRRIYALPFRDRVVQHWLIEQTLPLLEASWAPQSYACRLGKGTHRALKRAVDWARTRAWVLRLDVHRFFPSVDHELLRQSLQRTTPPALRWLRDVFIDAPVDVEESTTWFPGDELLTPVQRPHGIPIGSLTSQLWANTYLSPIDHLLRSRLGLPRFVRYCDDLLVFDDDKDRLVAAHAAIASRAASLRLKLHAAKSRLHRTSDPVKFLGFVLRRTRTGVTVRLEHDNVVRFRRRMAWTQRLFAAGALGIDEVRSRVQAWRAHAQHGQVAALLEAELGRLVWTRDEDRAAGRARS